MLFAAGTAAISVALLTSAASPYIYRRLPISVRNIPFVTRLLSLFLLDSLLLSLLALVDEAVDWGEWAVFGIIFFLRATEGFVIGILYIFVQVNRHVTTIFLFPFWW